MTNWVVEGQISDSLKNDIKKGNILNNKDIFELNRDPVERSLNPSQRILFRGKYSMSQGFE